MYAMQQTFKGYALIIQKSHRLKRLICFYCALALTIRQILQIIAYLGTTTYNMQEQQ